MKTEELRETSGDDLDAVDVEAVDSASATELIPVERGDVVSSQRSDRELTPAVLHDPPATTTPRGLPARGPRSAGGSDLSLPTAYRLRNQALVTYWVLPLIFLTVALLGGLRVSSDDRAFIFFPPPLITLVLAVLLMLLFVRGGLIELRSWIGADHPPLRNVSHIWLLLTLFFASAQAFNSVLPERGLLHWLFSFFFLWTLWNNQFSAFDARRLLRSLVVLFGTAFVLKHMLLASLYAPDGGWLKRLAGALAQGVSLGTLDAPMFAPATGYISFFTLGLYMAGLMLMAFKSER
ncbi:MAG TPA: hypothetical protein VFX97_11905 [Pyrinomonadaceae bacterium]|nr:hypothetical protein [Pyrinomonadaceae bacterium]